jgi:two-component system, chemotaxis family, protein-glutamate methylesterase/glutaminase
MKKTRVLIVDDSSTVRVILRRLLSEDQQIEIAGAAASGREALDRLDNYCPDIVLLDVEMPGMSGLETLTELRIRRPRLPVIMFSRLTQRGSKATIDALFLGADDYVPKPESRDELTTCVRDELLPRIQKLTQRDQLDDVESHLNPIKPVIDTVGPTNIGARDGKTTQPVVVRSTTTVSSPIKAVVIAASTGGPPILADLLSAIRPGLRVPVLVVQHMPANFTNAFASRLAEKSGLRVAEAADDQTIEDAQVWIAPGDYHMFITREADNARVQLNQGMPENACRPAANVLFRSAAQVFGAGVLGVVLTGMGNDGFAGSQAIVDAGGHVVVQDETSSTVWGMPGHVARAGLAEAILAPDELAKEISLRLMQRGVTQ